MNRCNQLDKTLTKLEQKKSRNLIFTYYRILVILVRILQTQLAIV